MRKYFIYAFGEILLVVSGILIALAINSWYQSRQDATQEYEYLVLLSRDVQNTLTNIETQAAFEAEQKARSIRVYRALSSSTPPQNTDSLSMDMSLLGARRTLALKNPTYQDLLNTGNLQLIRKWELRDRIVEFYEDMNLSFEIINKNNLIYVDEGYYQVVIESGLILPQFKKNAHKEIDLGFEQLIQDLEGGYINEPNLLWQISKENQEWKEVKSALLARLRTARVGERICNDLLEEASSLKRALEIELKLD